jgi:hypothetical protein
MIPRGKGSSSFRGGRGRGNILAQYGNKKLIAADLTSTNDPLYKEFLEFKKRQEGNSQASSSSYASIANEENEESITSYAENPHKEIIIFLEFSDIKRENNPWNLMQRYLDTASFPITAYKNRGYYEAIMKSSETCEITHYNTGNDQSNYGFSKIIIKKLIMPEEWGLSTLKEKEIFLQDKKITIRYNYWDYVKALSKVFLYENTKKKHSWFIKVCGEIYKRPIPNWFYDWWTNYGPSLSILPNNIMELYSQWVKISPKLYELDQSLMISGSGSMFFFLEFSIPWIWKWKPEIGETDKEIPCLKRCFLTKFWDKLTRIDNESGQIYGQEMISVIESSIKKYQEQNEKRQEKPVQSPFRYIYRRLKMQKENVTKEDILYAYIDEMKKDLAKNFEADNVSDVSMASSRANDDKDDKEEHYSDLNDEDFNEIFEKLEREAHNMGKGKTIS